VRNYSPCRIPIRLADNIIVYSGVGNVAFNPVMMDGKPSQPVEFTRVLHGPSLQNNLLSCLYLARHKNIIHIDSEQMDFSLNGKSLFYAPIRSENCAVLSGSSEPLSESANWVATCRWPPHSGIDAVVTTILQISPRCRRMLWWLGWHMHCLTSQILFASLVLLVKCTPTHSHRLCHVLQNHSNWFTWSSSCCHPQRIPLLDHR